MPRRRPAIKPACAQEALCVERDEAVGRALDASLSEASSRYRVEVSEVRFAARVVARLAFLYPPELQGASDSDGATLG